MEKPFVFGVATSGDNFTDRKRDATFTPKLCTWCKYSAYFS